MVVVRERVEEKGRQAVARNLKRRARLGGAGALGPKRLASITTTDGEGGRTR